MKDNQTLGILGSGVRDGLQLKPVRYEWAYRLYNQAVANTWFPNEVQMWEEANHFMTFEYIIETFPFNREEIYAAGWGKKSLADKAAFQTKYVTRMMEERPDVTTTEGKKDFVRNLVAYNIVLEGIWFYSGFMVGMSFRRRNLLRNVGTLLDWVTRDENLHLEFGINLLLTILHENPDLQDPEFADEIRNLILQAVELEEAYNRDMLPNGILGLNADYVNQYVKFMTDRRLEELGFEPEYHVANPAKWMAAANDTLELVNFFESTNTSYEVNTTK